MLLLFGRIEVSFAVAPVLSSQSPLNIETSVDPLSKLTLTFDQNIYTGSSGNISIRKTSDNSLWDAIRISDTTRISISGAVVSIKPRYYFTSGEGFYVEVDNTCFKNVLNEFYLGMSGSTTWSFTADANVKVVKLSAGVTHSMLLNSDGTVYAWGNNKFGELGDNSNTKRLTPTQVHGVGNSGFLTSIIDISAGGSSSNYDGGYSLALKNDGIVFAWGNNDSGQLGDSTTTSRTTPVQVHGVGNVGYLSGIVAVSAGEWRHSNGLKNDGSVYSWGNNNIEQLGDNTTNRRTTPVQVHGINNSGFLSGITAISTGLESVLALKGDGTVYTWGRNTVGELGCNSTSNKITPAQVVGVGGIGYLQNIISVSASGNYINDDQGKNHMLPLTKDGLIYSWGYNAYGQLGDNTTVNRKTPLIVQFTKALSTISISNQKVDEGVVANTSIGSFSTYDFAGTNTYIYSLVTGTGGAENTFNIDINKPLLTAVKDPLAKAYKLTADSSDSEVIIPRDTIITASNEDYGLVIDHPIPRITIPAKVVADDLAIDENQVLKINISNYENTKISARIKADDPNITNMINFCDFTLEVSDNLDYSKKITQFSLPLKIDIKEVNNIKNLSKTSVFNVIPEYDSNEVITNVNSYYCGGNLVKNEMQFYTDHFSLYIVMERDMTFSDISNSWAKDPIEVLASIKIISGSSGLFNPDKNVKRVDFSILMNNVLAKKPEIYIAIFEDVAEQDYFAGQILSLSKYGISDIKGGTIYSPAKYGVYDEQINILKDMTREQAANFLANAYTYIQTYNQSLAALFLLKTNSMAKFYDKAPDIG